MNIEQGRGRGGKVKSLYTVYPVRKQSGIFPDLLMSNLPHVYTNSTYNVGFSLGFSLDSIAESLV